MRSSAAGAPSGLALAGICRSSSARNGSNSEISIWSLCWEISISTDLFQRCEQEIAVQLLHIKLGRLSHTGPQDRTSLVMHFQHMSFRFFARIAKNPLKNHRDV